MVAPGTGVPTFCFELDEILGYRVCDPANMDRVQRRNEHAQPQPCQ